MIEPQEEMQTKIAFLEKAMNDLSDVVYRQQREIDALRHQLLALQERLAAASLDAPRVIEDERPPHY